MISARAAGTAAWRFLFSNMFDVLYKTTESFSQHEEDSDRKNVKFATF